MSIRPRFILAIATWSLALAIPAWAQDRGTLSGTVTSSTGTVVANAGVSLTNLVTHQLTQTQTDSGGHFELASVDTGSYELRVSAAGLDTNRQTIAIAAGANSIRVTLSAAPSLSLEDLGFTAATTHGSVADQERLDRRSHMLKIHQRLGLLTAVSYVATLIAANGAHGRVSTAGGRNLHAGFGVLTTGLYIATASFAIRAPKISNTETRGPIRIHKALAWIHGTGMVLTPILGGMALAQRNNGERVHGIANLHGMVGVITAASFGAAILSVSIKF